MNDITALAQCDINAAMLSSLEGYATLIVESLEFELGRELSEEECQRVYLHAEKVISKGEAA